MHFQNIQTLTETKTVEPTTLNNSNSPPRPKNLDQLKDPELLASTKSAIKLETESTIKVINHFQEIYDRQLYLKMGYANLFEFVTQYFKYPSGSAGRRINAMKLVRELPEVAEKLESGAINLTIASQVQSFFYHEQKEDRKYTSHQKLELIEHLQGKSTREVEKLLVSINPSIIQKDSIKPVSDSRVRISTTISNELNADFERIKNLLSHQFGTMTLEELLKYMTELTLEKIDPVRKQQRMHARKAKVTSDRTHRKIPANHAPLAAGKYRSDKSLPAPEVNASPTPRKTIKPQPKSVLPPRIKRLAWIANDHKGCVYMNKATGKICGSQKYLEVDHIQPLAHGGSNTLSNLRILCSAHNKWRWSAHI